MPKRKKNGSSANWRQQATIERDFDKDGEEEEEEEDTMDLDLETNTKKGTNVLFRILPSFIITALSSSSSSLLLTSLSLDNVTAWMHRRRRRALQNRWMNIFPWSSSSSSSHRHLDSSSSLDASDSNEPVSNEMNRYDNIMVDQYDSTNNHAEFAPANEKEMNDDVGTASQNKSYNDEGSGLLVEEAVRKAEQLQNELEAMTDSHNSLEQEYEASLRMLHDARMQLRRLQQQQQQGNNDADIANASDNTREEQQKVVLETMAKELEAKYKAQLKDKIERVRTQTAAQLRLELEAEIREEFTSQQQQQQLMTSSNTSVMEEEERTKLEEQLRSEMEERLSESKVQMESKFASDFQRAVDEASSLEVNRILDNAIQAAVQAEKSKSKADMLRVRRGIQKILEKERQLMREQVMRVTQQVREWVANQQREQLLQQAAVLQEEAERFGVGGGSTTTTSSTRRIDGGRGGVGERMNNGGGRRNPTSTSGRRRDGGQRPSPPSRRQEAARAAQRRVVDNYEDENGSGRYDDDDDGIGGGEG